MINLTRKHWSFWVLNVGSHARIKYSKHVSSLLTSTDRLYGNWPEFSSVIVNLRSLISQPCCMSLIARTSLDACMLLSNTCFKGVLLNNDCLFNNFEYLSRIVHVSMRFSFDAICSGVSSSLFEQSTNAPYFMSSSRMLEQQFDEAMCNGRSPLMPFFVNNTRIYQSKSLKKPFDSSFSSY